MNLTIPIPNSLILIYPVLMVGYCMYLYIDMKVENFILVLAQSELMSYHEPDDSDT
ncbi:hypothetical protein HanHA300_Chr15g0576831 [Helianthus annuus]|nr:hypothetical protein HanHA300_Chr15g0576831 [Helianthus annuus]